MPARDHSLWLRRALVITLKTAPLVTAHVGQRVEEHVTPGQVFPFIRVEPPGMAPWEATGVNGGIVDARVHTFAKGATSDAVAELNAAVVATLDQAAIEMEQGYLLSLDLAGVQTVRDPAPSTWHGIIDFNAVTGEEPA